MNKCKKIDRGGLREGKKTKKEKKKQWIHKIDAGGEKTEKRMNTKIDGGEEREKERMNTENRRRWRKRKRKNAKLLWEDERKWMKPNAMNKTKRKTNKEIQWIQSKWREISKEEN